MKNFKFMITLFVGLTMVLQNAMSQSTTLVVSADGTSKEEATKVALRNAIEQTYRMFVSANTTLLNDELVKDEIVTVTTGNIESFQEISCNYAPNGKVYVTLRAKVSVSKLISYAQSKGAETEFAGATFAMNMKMKELNKQNEMKALEHLLVQVKEILPYVYDYRLTIKEPSETTTFSFLEKLCNNTTEAIHAVNKNNFGETFKYTVGYNDPQQEYKFIRRPEKEKILADWLRSADNSYLMDMEVKLVDNKNYSSLMRLITETLQSLSISEQELKHLSELERKGHKVCINNYSYYLRNDKKLLDEWLGNLWELFANCVSDFVISDNLGQESFFYGLEYSKAVDYKKRTNQAYINVDKIIYTSIGVTTITSGEGLFSPFITISQTIPVREHFINDYRLNLPYGIYWRIRFLMPKDDIMKYSKFEVKKKNK